MTASISKSKNIKRKQTKCHIKYMLINQGRRLKELQILISLSNRANYRQKIIGLGLIAAVKIS